MKPRLQFLKRPRIRPLFTTLHRGYISVTEITQFLYAKGVDFHHCTDVAALRQLYRDVSEDCLQRDKLSASLPRPPSTDTGVIPDPHPGMDRHGIDPYQFVWEVKMQLCRRCRVDNKQMELLLNGEVLDDSKRICEYPRTKSFELTLRNKGAE